MTSYINLAETMPPLPPSSEIINSEIAPSFEEQTAEDVGPQEPNFIPGQFLYIVEPNSREMLQNGWLAITQLELWEFMKKDCDSYMLCNHPTIWVITERMEKLGFDGHSGFSFGWTMRQLQRIAKDGEVKYMQSWISTNN